jgi:hypothetical protein
VDHCDQAQWQKSSTSGVGECVEIAHVGDHVLIRDSKDPGGPVLRYTGAEWKAFVEGVQLGEFDV